MSSRHCVLCNADDAIERAAYPFCEDCFDTLESLENDLDITYSEDKGNYVLDVRQVEVLVDLFRHLQLC